MKKASKDMTAAQKRLLKERLHEARENRKLFKKKDALQVIAGRDKGKSGKFKSFNPKTNRVVVEGVNVYKKHRKPRPDVSQEGGIVDIEVPVHVSNLLLICPKCGQPTRTGRRRVEVIRGDKSKRTSVRVCRKCNKDIDDVK
jgi:large subunit ribosomal protein L24